ncbi:MAG: secondary thiamine-phosphate synthase enzyme YjbQ, partial [candidate division Zixibacteria bacterium]
MIVELTVKSSVREEMIDITGQVQNEINKAGIEAGQITCFVPHTTAAVTINENADPDVMRDMLGKLRREIPQQDGYDHAEGNSDAHLKSSLIGCSETILIENGQ